MLPEPATASTMTPPRTSRVRAGTAATSHHAAPLPVYRGLPGKLGDRGLVAAVAVPAPDSLPFTASAGPG